SNCLGKFQSGVQMLGLYAQEDNSGGQAPAIILLGIQPQHLDTGLELSETVRNGLEDLIQFLVDDLSRLGLPPVPRNRGDKESKTATTGLSGSPW
ncbi:MAG: hypothetical protein R6U55_17235, partial [Desulfovermiculus sp.]